MPSTPTFTTPPPPLSESTLLTFPNPTTILVTLNRPATHNCIASAQHHELDRLWTWMDAEPRIRCAILTGAGGKAFCAGADLVEWHSHPTHPHPHPHLPPTGFAGLSNRPFTKTPLIAAIDGVCLGGGFEILLATDIVLATPGSVFGLPEARVGVVAQAGVLPRLMRSVGRQRAMEMVLVGGKIGAERMRGWGVVNEVVGEGYGGGEYTGVVKRAIEVAETIAGNSPDSVGVSKFGVELGWAGMGVEEATREVVRVMRERGVDGGENMKEGVRAFVEKRRPRWVDSKL
ncbi:MAG: hypothetical protein Q9182_003018 [Xanthomendoza sp. 2 TL-2023]